MSDWGPLIGTKRQVTHDRRLYVGVGRGDRRRLAILPLLARTSAVTGLALLHLTFADDLPREDKERVLGARLERLSDLIAEANRAYEPSMLDVVTPEQLVLEDVEDLAEIVLNGGSGS